MNESTKGIDKIKAIALEVNRGGRVISLSGLTSIASKAFFVSNLRKSLDRPLVVITESNRELETLEGDLRFWLGDAGSVVTIPSFETDIYSGVSPHAETQERRALSLWRLSRAPADIVVTTAYAVASRTIAPNEIAALGAELERDHDFPPDNLIDRLVRAGYVREDPITNFGQFSVRGGIIDVWSPDAANPIRIEFFGDTIDSIREFDPETQLSTNQLRSADVAPMREFAASAQDMKDWAFFARERFGEDRFARNLKDRTDFADEGETFSGWEFHLPLVKPLTSSLFDHFGDCIFVIDEPSLIEQTIANTFDTIDRHLTEITASGDIGLERNELFLNPDELRERVEGRKRIELRALGRTAAATDEAFKLGDDLGESESSALLNETLPVDRVTASPLFLFSTAERSSEFEILSRSTRKFHGDLREFAGAFGSDGGLIVMQTRGMAERLDEMLRDYSVVLQPQNVLIGNLSGGFEIPSQKLVVYTEVDILGEGAASTSDGRRPAPNRKSRLGAFISDFRDLKSGDYVVHVDHGIGKFDSLQTLGTGGVEREFMLLIYADNTKLFVPVERMDLVSRYSSGETAEVALDRLGGLGWQKTKAKAKRAMRDMADELLKLYAERKLVQGYAFSPDAPWQHEFEDAFPYDLTTDQATAIEDVKGDMETPRPMDRLIIGDVGYGKTEVAMRAAFKAVMDGKQVAVLTPTTILAYQHYETFKRRFAAFPAKIDLLSRFRSTKEQKGVVEIAEKGDLDVLVGTHRILSTDVKLPKLGLVVVDEEQRFGVAHKEKLKHLKKKVDVLTLSATPIPRTLNMSLLGMRDMSVIETPPRDRLAINTQVVQFSEGVIRSAVELELARNGQVFFIHNRVETIESIAALVKKIVPNARVAIGHGQMNEKEMEQVMLDFMDYKYDILVATTIIENGIDIPRANTIIINR
ncbi:MAG TPA: DEAD/DEAH box helicase, partial [Pyrinomonadaceae bacterium]|nr:DEAD/DEAH box helicase [Pyrinomonadaceae bacterium]